ncbi:reticulocyte-binding protein 2 a [Podospora australis]|uniref:Reticulocyte-binding protein 2 a n=1 Tax=Podospora australis TaxID=1536484 RepID=A0AAN6X226_9PEZI|nr:reticulocyte-binding protein 2 a [Podospora australis]
MPATRKRARQVTEPDDGTSSAPASTSAPAPAPIPAQPSLLARIRSMWQFANLYQFMLLFGKALKLDDSLDIEVCYATSCATRTIDLEAECLKPGSTVLQEIGLGLLKFLSSHRGLTHELFDEYTRRQYLSKAPEKNPFGSADIPARFADFDIFTKIRVLQQMTQFVMMNPEKLRERCDEQKDMDQTNWRIEAYGWDRHDRTYFVLDDNRLYRMVEAPIPAPKPKKNTKKARAAQRASKRRRVSSNAASDNDEAGDEASEHGSQAEPEDDGLGGMKWECLAVTLDELRTFLSVLEKTKDANEKILREQLRDHLLPILEQQEQSRKRKQLQREKELLNLEKMVHAKRSSRIAGKLEHQKLEEQAREEEKKRREEEAARRKEELRQLRVERERGSRLKSREQRLKEREVRRLKHEDELAQLSEDSKSTSTGPARMSERRRLAEIERNQKALKELEEEEDDWIFDCVCGAYGQIDDGTHSVACERCNVWQHSHCLGIDEKEADQDDFHFICEPCRQRQHDNEHRPRIKLKVSRNDQLGASSSQGAAEEVAVGSSVSRLQLSAKLETEAVSLHNGSGKLHLGTDQTKKSTSMPSSGVDIEPPELTRSFDSQGSNPFASPHPNLFPPSKASLDPDRVKRVSGHLELAPSEGLGTNVQLSVMSESGSGPSVATKKSPAAPSKTGEATSPTSAGKLSTPSAPMDLPHSKSTHSQEERSDGWSSPLPPPSSGLSPTKHSSPAPQRRLINGNAVIAYGIATPLQPTASVFPPAAALSPSPRQQILTPPVKQTEPIEGNRVAQIGPGGSSTS